MIKVLFFRGSKRVRLSGGSITERGIDMKARFFITTIILFAFSKVFCQSDSSRLEVIELSSEKSYIQHFYDKRKTKIKTEGMLLNGRKDSLWTEYYKDGKVSGVFRYDRNYLVAAEKQYTRKGTLLNSGYENESSLIFIYGKKGKVTKNILWIDDIYLCYYYDKGKIYKTEEYNDSLAIVNVHNPDGSLRHVYEYDLFGKLLKQTIYTKEGVFLESTYYKEGKVFKTETRIRTATGQNTSYLYFKEGKWIREEIYNEKGELLQTEYPE